MRILLVEDDGALALALTSVFDKAGFAVDRAERQEDARLLLATGHYAALILDRGLPDGDGLDLLQALRGRGSAMPVIVLTARGALDARINGLDMGADDYLAKPFSPDELMARLRAVLRRNGSFQGREVTCGNLAFDIDNQVLRAGDQTIALSQREGALLGLLMRRVGLVVTRRLAEDQLFGVQDLLGSNAIEVYIHRLRHKLDAADSQAEIVTVRGVGYLLRAAP